jgi:hypothetical protein
MQIVVKLSANGGQVVGKWWANGRKMVGRWLQMVANGGK